MALGPANISSTNGVGLSVHSANGRQRTNVIQFYGANDAEIHTSLLSVFFFFEAGSVLLSTNACYGCQTIIFAPYRCHLFLKAIK